MIICIDSNVIIWGIKKQATAGQESLIGEAEYFFQWVDENNHEIIIPTVVIAEVLAREPDDVRARYLEVLKKSFVIVDFDTRAALKYAQLLHGRFEELKKKANEIGVDRQKLKMDHIIVASAIVHGARCLYSYDKGLRSFSQGYIDVRDFPKPPPKPFNLFEDLEIPAMGKNPKTVPPGSNPMEAIAATPIERVEDLPNPLEIEEMKPIITENSPNAEDAESAQKNTETGEEI